MYKKEALDIDVKKIENITRCTINIVYEDGEHREVSISSNDLVSILCRNRDNNSNYIYSIHRGKIIEIHNHPIREISTTTSKKHTVIKDNICTNLIYIKMDSSSNYESEIKKIDFDTIVDIRPIDYEFEEIEKEVYQVVNKHPIVENTEDDNIGEVFTTTGDLKKK